jgi:hypothetical protein
MIKILPRYPPPPPKRAPLKKQRKMIIPYSQMKIRENTPPPYSTLNPETSSDSPSEKSKGVRLLSLKQIKSQPKKRNNM